MHALALLCLVVAAAAKPQGTADDSVTTVTERSYTIRAEADKYYGNNAGYAYPYAAYPYSNPSAYSAYYSGVSPARTYQTYFQQAPAYQTYHHQAPAYQAYQTYQTYHHHAPAYQAYHAPTYHAVTAAPHTAVSYAAPAVSYETATAAPAVSYHTATAAPAVAYHTATAAPAVAYHTATAAPAVAYHTATAAPAVAYHTATAAPAVAYHTATAAPAVAYHTATAAPAVSYHAATAAPAVSYHTATAAPAVAYHQTANVAPVAVHSVAAPVVTVRNDYGNEAKVFKHVYAFAAPEEPATRALVHVEAPVNKRKHYKLVFIKAPTHETVVDSDITLPAQEEEKTLIYVLSKNQKQAQPEVRIKQSEASKHAKPEVFFLKYKNEAEAQAIASGAISGQTANVPAEGEIISDGSVSVLGQSSGAAFSSDALNANYGSTFESGAYDHSLRTGFSSQPALVYRAGISNLPARISTVSTGAVGIVPVTQSSIVAAAPVATVTPVTVVGDAASFGGFSGGFAFGRSADNEEPVNVGVKVNAEPSDAVETSTVATHSF